MTIRRHVPIAELNTRLSNLEAGLEQVPGDLFKASRDVGDLVGDVSNALLEGARSRGLLAPNDDRLREVEAMVYGYLASANPMSELEVTEGIGEKSYDLERHRAERAKADAEIEDETPAPAPTGMSMSKTKRRRVPAWDEADVRRPQRRDRGAGFEPARSSRTDLGTNGIMEFAHMTQDHVGLPYSRFVERSFVAGLFPFGSGARPELHSPRASHSACLAVAGS